tara:strand:- start:940 stop:1908 length:969 start_codon:yes stop_codon:yes gene_type:complete
MDFLKNKLRLILVGIFLLLFIGNLVLNNYVTGKIEDQLKSVTKEIPIKYDDISYSVISSTLSFENLYIGEDDEWLKIESLNLKMNPDDFPTKLEIEKMDFEMDLSDSELTLENLKIVDGEEILKLNNSSLFFNGIFSSKDKQEWELKFDNLVVDLEGLNFDSRNGKEDLSLDKLEIEFNSDDIIDLLSLVDQIEEIQDLSDMSLDINIENYDLPRQITKEMQLGNFGIRNLTGNIFKFEIEKDDQEIDFDFQLGSDSLGSFDIETSLDFSEDIKNPNIELELTLENLNKDLNKMFKKSKLEESDNGFSLEFDGKLNELQTYF